MTAGPPRSRRTTPQAALLAGLPAVILAVAGCSSAGHPGALAKSATPLSSSPSASASHVRQYLSHSPPAAARTPAPSPAPAAGPTGPATEPVATGLTPCPASALKITLGAAEGAAGSIYYPLDFTNVGSVTCSMYGYPGVAFATGAGGGVVGVPAVRNSTFPAAVVRLSPGATAHASLQVQVAQSYPPKLCKPVTAHWLQVYPPASYIASYVAFAAVTCTAKVPSGSTLGIYVVRPGPTGP